MLPAEKKPSEIWKEASQEARDMLSKIVDEAHDLWQKSPHYFSGSEMNRTPMVRVHWTYEVQPNQVLFAWVGEGLSQQLVISINTDNPVWEMLGPQPLISLLDIWLGVSDIGGFASSDFLELADKLDFRRFLEPFQNHPPKLKWAVVDLYGLLSRYKREYAELGSEEWGFWEQGGSEFSSVSSHGATSSKFGSLEDFLADIYSAQAFKQITQLERFRFSFEGWADYCRSTDAGSILDFDGATFGPLATFLSQQPPTSIFHQFGKAFEALKMLARMDFKFHGHLRMPDGQMFAPGFSKHINLFELVNASCDVGRLISEINFRMTEERRALLARKFEVKNKPTRTQKARMANVLDAKKRKAEILSVVSKLERKDYLTKSSGRLNAAKLARDISSMAKFKSVKSGMGQGAIAEAIRNSQTVLKFSDD